MAVMLEPGGAGGIVNGHTGGQWRMEWNGFEGMFTPIRTTRGGAGGGGNGTLTGYRARGTTPGAHEIRFGGNG